MASDHARTMPLSRALAKTFDGEMCNICRMVANAKQEERSRSGFPEVKLESKILLFFQAVPNIVVERPPLIAWRPTHAVVVAAGRSAPPVPPPRAGLV